MEVLTKLRPYGPDENRDDRNSHQWMPWVIHKPQRTLECRSDGKALELLYDHRMKLLFGDVHCLGPTSPLTISED